VPFGLEQETTNDQYRYSEGKPKVDILNRYFVLKVALFLPGIVLAFVVAVADNMVAADKIHLAEVDKVED